MHFILLSNDAWIREKTPFKIQTHALFPPPAAAEKAMQQPPLEKRLSSGNTPQQKLITTNQANPFFHLDHFTACIQACPTTDQKQYRLSFHLLLHTTTPFHLLCMSKSLCMCVVPPGRAVLAEPEWQNSLDFIRDRWLLNWSVARSQTGLCYLCVTKKCHHSAEMQRIPNISLPAT